MKFSSILKDASMLLVITAVLAVVLSVAKVGTQSAIDAANLAAQMKAFNEVCPGYNSNDNITGDVVGASAGVDNASLNGDDAVLRCKNEAGDTIGYIVQCTSKGFGGPLNLIVGFDKEGNVTGVRYANTPQETPGLGMKTTEASFLEKWLNVNNETVSGVDTISGATVSSTAFKQAVTLACMFANRAVTLDGGV
ncbi:MAG: FMN-binding protein [Lachnospiraceae bacterium]|nr:FMN-binding protein [Lachnospiraceae bacterium]